MKGYFDMHCHILPGIDDGAKDEKEMLKMLQIAYDDGIRYMFTTPHYHPARGDASADRIECAYNVVQEIIKEQFPDMKLYKGNEIYYRQDLGELLRNGTVLSLAGSDYVLVEFPFSTDTKQIKKAVGQVQMAGYLPVVAHVERYEQLIGEYDFIQELTDAGVYFQVNADSVTGELGRNRKKFVKKLIKNECVHFIGTDAHDSVYRTPRLQACATYLKKKFDEDTANILLYYNPIMVVKNKVI